MKPQLDPSQVADPLAGAEHTRPQAPQLAVVITSVQTPSQSWYPALQAKPQCPPSQVAVALAGAEHTWPQAPQLVVVVRSVQAPLQRA